jgi:hypothetical protein
MYTGNISTTSNRADWQDTIALVDQDTGEAIDISLARITMTVRRLRRGQGYFTDYYYGSPLPVDALLTGSTDTGEITVVDTGTFQWLFPFTRMASLCQGEYQIGVRISQSGSTMQLIIGTVTVLEGIDNQ